MQVCTILLFSPACDERTEQTVWVRNRDRGGLALWTVDCAYREHLTENTLQIEREL
jgi:hypothetical protein